MTGRFCSQCGRQIPAGYSFCSSCGAAQSDAKELQQTYQPSFSGQQVYQQPTQSDKNPYYDSPQAYQQSYSAGARPGYSTPRATSTKATGLIIGIFALIATFLLVVLILVLPAQEDFPLLGAEGGLQTSGASAPAQTANAGVPAADKYGEPPASVFGKVNVNAKPEDYSGSYSGTASFRNENLHIMSDLLGDSSYEDILSAYNGKTYDCTAVIDDSVRAFSPEIYSENEDGSFYTYYYFDYDLENGVALYEESDYDEELQCRYYIADKAYFLTDGGIYVINITTAEFDDGRSVASEIRIELQPSR